MDIIPKSLSTKLLWLLISIGIPSLVNAQSDFVDVQDIEQLREAIEANDLATVDLFSSNVEIVNTPDERGFTPLIMAIDKENLRMVKLLVEKGANVNIDNNRGIVRDRPGAGTPLMHAVRDGPWNGIVEYLISQGADIDAIGPDGNTALTEAIRYSYESVELLLERGAGVNTLNSAGFTALDIALSDGWSADRNLAVADISVLLLQHGGELGPRPIKRKFGFKRAPLLAAVVGKDINEIETIGKNVSKKTSDSIRRRAWTLALQIRDRDVISKLQEAQLRPDSKNFIACKAMTFSDVRTLSMILKENPNLLTTEFLPETDLQLPKLDNDYTGFKYKRTFEFRNGILGWLSCAGTDGYSDDMIDFLIGQGVTANSLVSYSVASQMADRALQSGLLPYRRFTANQKAENPGTFPPDNFYQGLIDHADKKVEVRRNLHQELREKLGCTSRYYNICNDN